MTRLTDEQLAMRRQGIGSSDITAILGVSPYADHTPISVLMDKRGLVHRKPEDETPAMRLGHMLEDVAATMYVDDFGVELVKCSTIQSISARISSRVNRSGKRCSATTKAASAFQSEI